MSENHWIGMAVDPREVSSEWVDQAVEGAPLQIKRKALSHNAADTTVEIIRLALPYIALVWNPFVTAIATEAGKDTYKLLRTWLGRFMERVAGQPNPILIIEASLKDCDVSFIVRGNDFNDLIAARAGLEAAASQAANLVRMLKQGNASPRALFYEFDKTQKIWIPSYAELDDGQLITDNRVLVVAESLPQGLSLGLRLEAD